MTGGGIKNGVWNPKIFRGYHVLLESLPSLLERWFSERYRCRVEFRYYIGPEWSFLVGLAKCATFSKAVCLS